MKIRKLQLKNIGVFDDETIEFQPCPAKDKAEIHIFTGQNGSGKSTILMALASLFRELQYNSFSKRHRNEGILGSQCAVTLNDGNTYSTYSDRIEDERTIVEILGNYSNDIQSNKDLKKYVEIVSSNEKHIFTQAQQFDNFKFAVFAYSGYRFVKAEKVELLKKYEENPLTDSLNFIKSYDNFSINQWIVNNLSQRALAKEQVNFQFAERFDENIKNLAFCLSAITKLDIDFKLNFTTKELVLIIHNQELDFDVLPDGLRSLISWIGDLLMRLDSLKWENDTPIFEREIILFLDEIEVHLHPAWQRKVLPVVQKLFKNSQIFVSTHSPFVVNSVDDAWVYKLKLEDGKAKIESIERSEDARSYRYVLRNTFDIENEFGIEIEKRLADFYKERDSFLAGNGNSKKAKKELKKIAEELSEQSSELKGKIDFELFQLSEITGEDF